MFSAKRILYFFILYLLSYACAQQQQLQGGPKDTTPPQLIKELSTPNLQTNFEKQTIELAFDEFIEIRNVSKQVLVSPPLVYPVVVERKRGFKTAQFKFNEKEVLKEGVTYAINFGTAIQDLTEGNTVPDLQFLFSTGDYIDSLKMTGSIVDALTGEPVENVLFMLYENLADTVVRMEKPYYFGKTGKDGKFIINYIKTGKFKGFALEDQDLNYLFNIPKERIGFLTDTIRITDSTSTDILIKLFEQNTVLDKPKADISTYGFIKLGFRRNPYDAIIETETVGQEIYQETEGDTIKIWYHLKDSIDWNLFVRRDTFVDTFAIKAKPEKLNPIALSRQKAPEYIPINPFKSLQIPFNHPLKNIDAALIIFRENNQIKQSVRTTVPDSLKKGKQHLIKEQMDTSKNTLKDSTIILPIDSINKAVDSSFAQSQKDTLPRIQADFVIDSTERRTLIITYDWKETFGYELEILPDAITDWYGQTNRDTILLKYEVLPKADFGTINLAATQMDSTQHYWFQLLFKNNVVEEFAVSEKTTHQQSFSALAPGEYSLRIIEDLNGNGRWDSGDYDKKLQPEKIALAKIEQLRAGWDVEAEVEVKF